ncbi:MAG: sugar phosphate nucleotidyltransferase [Acidimicrobiia bacterium]
METSVRPVILSGGAGTRLWPISTPEHPKQFIELLDESLFDSTLGRISSLGDAGPATVVAGLDHVERIEAAIERTGARVDQVLIEPRPRNTGPAVVAAAMAADPDDVLVVLPSDHMIQDAEAFGRSVSAAVDLALQHRLVTFGVAPTRPETGYGYVEIGEPMGSGYRVSAFHEKPDLEAATAYWEDGRHLWNSGMFVFKSSDLLEEVRRLRPALAEGVAASMPDERDGLIQLGSAFERVEAISIDHAVMETTDLAAVIPIDVGWSDLGSFQSLWEAVDRSPEGNAQFGDVVSRAVTNSLMFATSRRVAIAGVDGLVVVETPEAVLVLPLAESQMVRDLAVTDPDSNPTD